MELERKSDPVDPVTAVLQLCRYLSERSSRPTLAVDGTTHVVTYVNRAFAQLVGREIKDLVGRPFAEAVPEGVENGCLRLLDRVFHSGTAENLEEQEHQQLQPRPVYWSYAMWAILGTDERPIGVMIQVTDVTETALFRKQSIAINETLLISATRQHELTEVAESLSEKLQAAVEMRDRFIAVMSHELRNPLTTLSTGLEVLKLAAGDAVTTENTRAMMERQLKQIVRLVDDLLDVSRITMGKLELHRDRVELASVLRDAVEASRALIDQQGHKLTITLPSDPILLDADPARLTQVFWNLLNNAAKYSEGAGEIQLSAELDRSDVVVRVRDKGIGIPAAKLPHIFEAFVQVDTSWQRTQGGMGIGLSLVKEFVGLHGGHVTAQSDGPGKGSEFVVRLPVAVGTAIDSFVSAEKSHGPCRRILVVDDNRDAAQSLSMMLKFLGHDVRTAHDGEAAVATAVEYRPALVLMDLGMPKVDGYEACRRIRAESWGGEPFMVALTGWGSVDDLRRTRDVGFDEHLVKPVDTDALMRIFSEISTRSFMHASSRETAD